MFKADHHRYLVPFDGSFRLRDMPTMPAQESGPADHHKKKLRRLIGELRDLQRLLYADDRYALLLIFQAMDAGGKDSTIRAVMTGVNPAGCEVYAFKTPSSEELDHDFLWRTTKRLPQRGRIGIFNRSYYEEVLVVRVHPELLRAQKLPDPIDPGKIWHHRYDSIQSFEQHLARNGTIVLKFWLNISKEQQRQRFLARLKQPEKNWKFSPADVRERAFWDDYMSAYEAALAATSRPWAPWYAIPADNKPYMRYSVAKILVQTLKKLDLAYPSAGDSKTRLGLAEMLELLEGEL